MYMIVAVGREGGKTPASSARTGSSDERKGTAGPETGGEVPGRDSAAQKTGTLFPIAPASFDFSPSIKNENTEKFTNMFIIPVRYLPM